MRRLEPPPSSITGAYGNWLRKVWALLEASPNFSLVSLSDTDTPNSRVTGYPGDFCINLGSASTASRVWTLGGPASSALTDQGWALVRIVQV